jgi:general secretion pathway protein E
MSRTTGMPGNGTPANGAPENRAIDEQLKQRLQALSPSHGDYASDFVQHVLTAAISAKASDVHFQPGGRDVEIRWRLDGVLQSLGAYSRGDGTDVLARLKVLAGLLTYRTDVPQEGRIAADRLVPGGKQKSNSSLENGNASGTLMELRVATFPTLHGERIVARLLAANERLQSVADLHLPGDIEETLRQIVSETSGAFLLTGPAGSGKTTTIYALLREIANGPVLRSVVSIEDPVERAIDGVAQANIQPNNEFDFAAGLKSLLRQDPEVIVVGEIRDQTTAETVLQASLTGHLVFSSLHSGRAADAVARLIDWKIDPYAVNTGLLGVMCQRLVRRLCACRAARGCPECLHTGYRGRIALAELMSRRNGTMPDLRTLASDATAIHRAAIAAGMTSLATRAKELMAQGEVDEPEICRVLGISWRAAE